MHEMNNIFHHHFFPLDFQSLDIYRNLASIIMLSIASLGRTSAYSTTWVLTSLGPGLQSYGWWLVVFRRKYSAPKALLVNAVNDYKSPPPYAIPLLSPHLSKSTTSHQHFSFFPYPPSQNANIQKGDKVEYERVNQHFHCSQQPRS